MRLSRLMFSVMSALLVLAAAPALAQAASQALAITSPTGFPAGGHPTVHEPDHARLERWDAVDRDGEPGPRSARRTLGQSVVREDDPGSGTACEIGTGTVTLAGLPAPVTAYLAPPPSKDDVVGIDVVALGVSTTHGAAQLVQTKSGNLQTVLSLSLSGLGPLASMVSGMSLTINGTLGGKPFNRMPTNCSPGSSTLTVVYTEQD